MVDVEALQDLLADEGGRAKLREWLKGLSEEDRHRLDELRKEEPENTAQPEDEAAKFWSDLGPLKAAVNSRPGDVATETALAEMAQRAKTLGSCETVQVMGLQSYRARLLGDLSHAERLLADAGEVGSRCPLQSERCHLSACELDLERRVGILEAALGRPEVGLRRVQRVLDGYEALGHPGHDIDRDGIASCHYARAEIRFELQDLSGSAADLSICLDRFRPNSPVWERVHQDFTMVLSRTDRAGKERAWDLQRRRRLRMSHRKGTTEYAFFFWTDGQLAAVLGKQRAISKMKSALAEFGAQRMPDQVVGVGHDIAAALWPNRERIWQFFKEEFLPMARDLVRDRRQVEALNGVISLLRGCPRPDSSSLLATALRRVRDLAGPHLPPCLIVTGR